MITSSLQRSAKLFNIQIKSNQSSEFREQCISVSNIEMLKKVNFEELDFFEEITLAMLGNQYDLSKKIDKNDLKQYKNYYFKLKKYRQKEWKSLVNSYKTIWSDLKYFPIPDSISNKNAKVSFEDTWFCERTYGGERHHEGTDIMAGIQKRGYYPVLSMTDGIVEKMGWLNMGGYRIGIRSNHGAYFYYAHLESYAYHLKEGDKVKAGQLIGYMGDTGYGETEGTKGKFPIHLHLGIYFNPNKNSQLSVNPYWILKYIEKYKLKYSY
ncbi:M23 family peptidase [Anaerosacchariphilus polymeriproducens]|uniref:M23 family peptidase n=2 Tax=Anaerosacchariphilus polymeriproducens TaxID=1812858 RepID=A0A371AUC2_9FIRM|nr:M23 family peptidase [Anaerosacchariphilus polymeriproducens]